MFYFKIIAMDWPQQVHVSNVKCEHKHSSEQLARHSKVILELV